MSALYIFVNGIWNLPSDSRGWNDRAVTWIQTRTEHRAEKFEYFAAPLTRRVFQSRHAADLLDLLRSYTRPGHREIHLVAHSNGADLALRALASYRHYLTSLHLFSPACEPDFILNGLNIRLASRLCGIIPIYIAGQDRAMKLAQLSRTLAGWLGLGYGTLGLDGPRNLCPLYVDLVPVYREATYGHSDWFTPANFERTMQLICPQTKNQN